MHSPNEHWHDDDGENEKNPELDIKGLEEVERVVRHAGRIEHDAASSAKVWIGE